MKQADQNQLFKRKNSYENKSMKQLFEEEENPDVKKKKKRKMKMKRI
jgi:hypothetical protein